MTFELMADGLSADWVESLCPADLRRAYDEMIRSRAARQREQLNIQVSAAAVVADGGKSAQKLDSALRDVAAPNTVGENTSALAEGQASPEQITEMQAKVAAAEHLWRK